MYLNAFKRKYLEELFYKVRTPKNVRFKIRTKNADKYISLPQYSG